MAIRSTFGAGLSRLGTALHLPEYGLSEKIGGGVKTYDYLRPPHASAASGNDVYYERSADGGWNFFVNGQQASIGDYSLAGGRLPPELVGSGTPAPSQQQTTQDTGSGDGSGTPTEPQTYQFGGQQYNDPISYANAVTEASVAEFTRQNKLLTDAYNNGLLDFADYKKQLEQARATIKDQYGQAMGGISGRFSANSPDAYQSAQGTAENRAGDITNQNYANVAGQEANLNRDQSQYSADYANNLESNRLSSQNQIDQTINDTRSSLADTPYANQMGNINAPKLNTMTPMDSSVLGIYDNIAQLHSAGNFPAVKTAIDSAQVDPTIKEWLYTRFPQQQI